MLQHKVRSFHKIVICSAGFLLLLLITGCAGVAGSATPTGQGPNGTTNAGGVAAYSSGGNQSTFIPGTIAFTGQVQQVSANSITVRMPDGSSSLSATITAQTDHSDFNGASPTQGQTVELEVTANPDGSFTATEVKPAASDDPQDQNTVTYTGMTTATVGADNVLHFQVGKQSFGFTITSTTEFNDDGNAQAIGSNQPIKVDVQFQGTTGTVVEISNPND